MPEDSTVNEGDLALVDAFVLFSELMQKIFEECAERSGLTSQQARLLGILRDRTPTMAELARLIDLDRPSTSGLVRRAEGRGLVERIPVPEDGRSYRVRLTAAGRRQARAFVADVTAQVGAVTGPLDPTDAHRLAALMTRVIRWNADARRIDLSAGTRRT